MSRHNMADERSLGVKIPGESKVDRPCRGTGEGGGHNSNFVETKVLKFFFKSQFFV